MRKEVNFHKFKLPDNPRLNTKTNNNGTYRVNRTCSGHKRQNLNEITFYPLSNTCCSNTVLNLLQL